MGNGITRRELAVGTTAAGLAWLSGGRAVAAPFKTKLLKAAIVGLPNAKGLESLKAAGYDGVETRAADASVEEAAAAKKAADSVGMKIHSVMRGWMSFNGNPDQVAKTIARTETSLRAAQAFGADAILLVPCRIGGKMPQPWEFKIDFDPKTLMVKCVVEGDNAPYADYIKAQNHATASSIKAVEKLIPVAEKTGVRIALENVWNNLWVKPAFFAAFVKSFKNEWVKAYFDIGNHVKYAPPEEFIRALGKTTVKYHVKDYKLNANGQGGNWAKVGEGSVNWPLVRKLLEELEYSGWLTLEGNAGKTREEQCKILDRIIRGE